MTENENTLTKTPDIMKPRRDGGLKARRQQVNEKLRDIKPEECTNRLGLIFDDSGSMMGEPLKNAKMAVQNFTDACDRMNCSIALYQMNQPGRPLTIDYPALNILVQTIHDRDLGGTPLYATLTRLLEEVDITRGVIFSDGSPTDGSYKETAVINAIERKIPVDTIFIGMKDSPGFKEMKYIADRTGGIFIWFEDSKSLSRNLKYLSPALRPLLANAEIKAKIQRGESV